MICPKTNAQPHFWECFHCSDSGHDFDDLWCGITGEQNGQIPTSVLYDGGPGWEPTLEEAVSNIKARWGMLGREILASMKPLARFLYDVVRRVLWWIRIRRS